MSAEDATPMEASATTEVDEKLYSRQLYVMGHEAQRRMMASKALMIGCSGLGVEVAKNCILAGIHSLVVVDPLPPNTYDVGGNFFLKPEDVVADGAISRAEICRPLLAELNPYVNVSVASDVTALTAEQLVPLLDTGITCLVVTIPLSNELLVTLNEKCRSVNASFVYSLSCGVFGQVFCDFGSAFVCADKDGNPPATSQIESVFQEGTKVVVKVLEDLGRHALESGDMITFARLKGLSGLEINKNYTVNVTSPYMFEIEGAAIEETGGKAQQGYITQVKQPVTIAFETYEKRVAEPGECMMSDFAKFDRPLLLHKSFQALEEFRCNHNDGEFPTPGDTIACTKVLDIVKAAVSAAGEDALTSAQERIVLQLASGSKAILSPMCAALGGIVGQEVLKACSGKFSPINGFFFLDADETLPDEILPADEVAAQNDGTRYDSQIACFGKEMQAKLLDLNYFIVGAGAIGCEMLKNWALMGVGCGPKGHVTVTDMDIIEKSNLSRQFLFRSKDISDFKSSAAASAVQGMNPGMNITALQEKVAPDTENVFGDTFYDKLSGVCTALDNVEARLYVDQRCVFYQLPMLESGTLGTKGNTQVVVPGMTENYGATRDPPEKSIPVCTLKNFPSQIQHTLQWARDYFEGEFKQSAEDVNSYLSQSSEEYISTLQPNNKTETLKIIRRTLVDDRPMTFEDCVGWARLKFEDLFDNQIRQLLHNFPEDQVTSTGTQFWSGSKRCPVPINFGLDSKCEDAEMFNHLDFIVAAANLRATMYGIKGRTDKEYFKATLNDVIVPDFTPADGVKIAANDAEAKANDNDTMDTGDVEADRIWNSLPKKADLAGFQLAPIDFDKDLDDHMLFVTACSNLRALNYQIPTEDTHRSRAIAGRIIPAIATTTALVAGLICMELYKIVGTSRRAQNIEDYKNGFLNLAVPFMTLSEPTAPKGTKCVFKGKEWEWTAWDSISFDRGNVTLGEFMDYFETEYNLDISMLSYGVSILYSFFANKKKVEERKKMTMTDVITSITKKEFPEDQLFIILEVIANDKDTDEDVDLPYIKFRFRA